MLASFFRSNPSTGSTNLVALIAALMIVASDLASGAGLGASVVGSALDAGAEIRTSALPAGTYVVTIDGRAYRASLVPVGPSAAEASVPQDAASIDRLRF